MSKRQLKIFCHAENILGSSETGEKFLEAVRVAGTIKEGLFTVLTEGMETLRRPKKEQPKKQFLKGEKHDEFGVPFDRALGQLWEAGQSVIQAGGDIKEGLTLGLREGMEALRRSESNGNLILLASALVHNGIVEGMEVVEGAKGRLNELLGQPNKKST